MIKPHTVIWPPALWLDMLITSTLWMQLDIARLIITVCRLICPYSWPTTGVNQCKGWQLSNPQNMQQLIGPWLSATMNSSLRLLHLNDSGKPICSLHLAHRQTPYPHMLATGATNPWLTTMLALSGVPQSHHDWNEMALDSAPWITLVGVWMCGFVSLDLASHMARSHFCHQKADTALVVVRTATWCVCMRP